MIAVSFVFSHIKKLKMYDIKFGKCMERTTEEQFYREQIYFNDRDVFDCLRILIRSLEG